MSEPSSSSNTPGRGRGRGGRGRGRGGGRGGRGGGGGRSNSNGTSSSTRRPPPTNASGNDRGEPKQQTKHDAGTAAGGPISKRPRRVNAPSSETCRAFAQNGTCPRGDDCRYKHASGEDNDHDVDMSDTITSDAIMSVSAPASDGTQKHITNQRFADLPISNLTKRAMSEVFKYECMTVVQAETIHGILKGADTLARAKTGTGKTLAFLIPAVELLTKFKLNANDISCLVLSPTRELAFQIQTEAESLTKFHSNMTSVAIVGGTTIGKDHRALKMSTQILVATPGRLLDHLQNFGLAQRLQKMKILIFDECDQLLDQGFRPDLEKILKLLEPSKATRQTLLFSATMPASVSDIAALSMKKDYDYIDTVGEDEEHTHMHVQQDLLVTTQEQQIAAMEQILAEHTSQNPNYKIIVFFTTARLTGFMADLFNSQSSKLGYSVLEIHSRKSQSIRQKASDRFRSAKNAVLFSSDVSARGMDYPDVSFVLQVGLTERAQDIHRLGRTARAGKAGKGALLVADYEERWMRQQLNDLPLQSAPVPAGQGSGYLQDALAGVSRDKDLAASAEQAYRAWLGFYNGHTKKVNWSKDDLVHFANQWAKDVGLKEQPSLLKKTVGKMGLKGVRGLKVE